MDADEREIFHFLKTRSGEYTSAMEICRRAGNKRKFSQDPNWAKPVLLRMAERHILEADQGGRYRIKPKAGKHKRQWVSPEIAKILEQSGGSGSDETGEDEYYENL